METTRAVIQSGRSQARYVEVSTVLFRITCNQCGDMDEIEATVDDGRTMGEVQASFDEYHACS